MSKCDFCEEERKVIVTIELFNSEVDEKPISKKMCLLCVEERKSKIDIRECFHLILEDMIDYPEVKRNIKKRKNILKGDINEDKIS